MIIKIKKYVATVARYVEDGEKISKIVEDITIKGQRISPATVEKQIPRGVVLISHGYREEAFEVDAEKLLEFCRENGKELEEGNRVE